MSETPEPGAGPSVLYGRAKEVAAIHALVANARDGVSGALLIEGDPGVGKTAVLDDALRVLNGVRVLRISGYEVEAAFAYAALQRLGGPLREFAAGMPDLQQGALRVAVGLGAGDPPQRALVGLGVLSLLSLAGDDQPTVCVVDDAHNLDGESIEVLGFVARRLSAERVALIFAAREDAAVSRALAGVPRLALTGLDIESAAALLQHSVDGDLDPTVVARFVSFTGGNPLALSELGAQWSSEELTTVAIAHEPVPIGRKLDDHYRTRVESLPPETQLWLLVAAAESTGDASVVRETAVAIGIADGASAHAENAGLVDVRDTVRFRHPLVRSAVYSHAADADRRRVHRALQVETSTRGWQEIAAWHAATACSGPNQKVADQLAAVADLAAARGGLESRAQLLARAAELAVEPQSRSQLLLGAAEAAIGSGAGLLARQFLARVSMEELDRAGRGRYLLVQSLCSLYLSDPVELRHGVTGLLAAADEFRGELPALEQRALLLAVTFIQATEESAVGITLPELGERLREGAESEESPYAIALRATSSFILDDYNVAVPRLREAVRMLETLDDRSFLAFSFYCVTPAVGLWDAGAASRLLQRTVRIGREYGALREVDAALWVLSAIELGRMNPQRAGHYLTQAEELRKALGHADQQLVNVAYLAWQGTPRATLEQLASGMLESGFGGVARMAAGAMAANEIADGDYQTAFERLGEYAVRPFLQAGFPQLGDLVEAAVRSGNIAAARKAADQLSCYAAASGSPWVVGISRRCEALLATDDQAEAHYRASLVSLEAASHRGDRARTELVYGEWLRRMRRRSAARAALQEAWDGFEETGAVAFAQRARRELKATGAEPVESASVLGTLTAQEVEVARLAARGATNAEIGAALFISANTVDYHLRKVFRKLEVTSRRQLAEHVASGL